MGYHYFNADLMADDTVNLLQPEVLVYETGDDGDLELVAVEWAARGPNSTPRTATAPTVLGHPMHILVPAVGFHIMHAWIWKPNPAGMFADFNPDVTCPDRAQPAAASTVAGWAEGSGVRPDLGVVLPVTASTAACVPRPSPAGTPRPAPSPRSCCRPGPGTAASRAGRTARSAVRRPGLAHSWAIIR